MKFPSFIIICILSFALAACEQSNKDHENQVHAHHVSMQMNHLTILIEHAISMMAQGAELKQQDLQHGNQMLSESASLLRRAMSGPEMSAMHQGGHGTSLAMRKVHDLGAASFDLLELMMDLEKDSNKQGITILHHALNMAAEAANLDTLTHMGMSEDIDHALQAHSKQMQEMAGQLIQSLKQF